MTTEVLSFRQSYQNISSYSLSDLFRYVVFPFMKNIANFHKKTFHDESLRSNRKIV